jgi:hypothetical protein
VPEEAPEAEPTGLPGLEQVETDGEPQAPEQDGVQAESDPPEPPAALTNAPADTGVPAMAAPATDPEPKRNLSSAGDKDAIRRQTAAQSDVPGDPRPTGALAPAIPKNQAAGQAEEASDERQARELKDVAPTVRGDLTTAPMTAPQPSSGVAPAQATPVAAVPLEPAISSVDAPDWRLNAGASASAPVAAEGARQSAPVPPQAVAGQVAVAITTTRERQVELRLDPPELGRVQIQLDTSDGGLRAVIVAERTETHDLLRRHAEALERELAEAGFRNVDLGFASGERQTERDPDAEGADAGFAIAAARTEAAPLALRVGLRADGGLDIRL